MTLGDPYNCVLHRMLLCRAWRREHHRTLKRPLQIRELFSCEWHQDACVLKMYHLNGGDVHRPSEHTTEMGGHGVLYG